MSNAGPRVSANILNGVVKFLIYLTPSHSSLKPVQQDLFFTWNLHSAPLVVASWYWADLSQARPDQQQVDTHMAVGVIDIAILGQGEQMCYRWT